MKVVLKCQQGQKGVGVVVNNNNNNKSKTISDMIVHTLPRSNTKGERKGTNNNS